MRIDFYSGKELPLGLSERTFLHPQDKKDKDISSDGFRLPGIIDIHIHGAFGWDFSFGDPEKINELLDKLLVRGITGVVPTLITCTEEERLKALTDIKKVAETRDLLPQILGIHLEGPYLSHEKKGSHPEELLKSPDINELKAWQKAAGGLIKIITIAPELPGSIEFIKEASKLGIICSLGHSEANSSLTLAAIEAGAKHVTHLFNAMPPLNHRAPGLLSAVLTNKSTFIELIADGLHVSPEMIKFVYSNYESDQVILVSDAVAPAGCTDGFYNLYGQDLEIHNGKCCFAGGHFFGGGRLLPECLKIMNEQAEISWGVIGTSIWRTPCKLLGLSAPDTEVLFDSHMKWLASRHNGKWVWKKDH